MSLERLARCSRWVASALPKKSPRAVVWLCSDAAAFITGIALPDRRRHHRPRAPRGERRAASERERDAVAARVGGGDVAAALLVDLDHLRRAHDRVDRVGEHRPRARAR